MSTKENWVAVQKLVRVKIDDWRKARTQDELPGPKRQRLSEAEVVALFRLKQLGIPPDPGIPGDLGIPPDPVWIQQLPYFIAGPSGESGPELLARYERITGTTQ